MATIIKSISFQNFYNYYGNFDDNTYYFKEGINIINADNNMGKSKFFNGILWILKDVVVDSDKRNKEVSAKSSFHKMASGKAMGLGENFDMGVKIIFINNGDKYSVSKIVQFNKDGLRWKTNEVLNIIETVNNCDIPILDVVEKNKIIKKIIPGELINYALLQGESMETLVDLSSHNGLSSTIEVLAGINNLIETCEISKDLTIRVKRLFNDKQRDINASNRIVSKLINEKVELEGRIENTKEQVEVFKTELSEAKKKKENLEALILNATNREKFRQMLESKRKEIESLKNDKAEKERNITQMLFSENSAWLLMNFKDNISLFEKKRHKLTVESTTKENLEHQINLPEGSPDSPSLLRMLRIEKCEVCGNPAPKHSESWNHIKKVLDRPSPNQNTNKNNFNSFYSGIQKSVGVFYHSIPRIKENIKKYRDEVDALYDLIRQKEEEKENAKVEFLNAGGSESNTDNNDKQNIFDYRLAEKTIDKIEKKISEGERFIIEWETRLKQIEKEISKSGSNNEIENYKNFKELLETVESIFFATKERVFDDIVSNLEINANEIYEELTYGNSSLGGKLVFNKQEDGTVQVSIKNKDNGELTGLGTGFQRMKQLSIIMAIISSKIIDKRFDYPFISDAPFSEFGDNFINNFFRIAPKVLSQSIILIKELYDPKSEILLNDLGTKVLEKMVNGDIPGTFYVNIIEEKADTTNLVTKNKCYKE